MSIVPIMIKNLRREIPETNMRTNHKLRKIRAVPRSGWAAIKRDKKRVSRKDMMVIFHPISLRLDKILARDKIRISFANSEG